MLIVVRKAIQLPEQNVRHPRKLMTLQYYLWVVKEGAMVTTAPTPVWGPPLPFHLALPPGLL